MCNIISEKDKGCCDMTVLFTGFTLNTDACTAGNLATGVTHSSPFETDRSRVVIEVDDRSGCETSSKGGVGTDVQ